MEPGDCSVRGDILDIFPPAMESPVRLDFFGDEITGMRTFDPLNQRSTGSLVSVAIDPASEVLLDPESIERFRTGWRELFGIGSVDDLSTNQPLREAAARAWNTGSACSTNTSIPSIPTSAMTGSWWSPKTSTRHSTPTSTPSRTTTRTARRGTRAMSLPIAPYRGKALHRHG